MDGHDNINGREREFGIPGQQDVQLAGGAFKGLQRILRFLLLQRFQCLLRLCNRRQGFVCLIVVPPLLEIVMSCYARTEVILTSLKSRPLRPSAIRDDEWILTHRHTGLSGCYGRPTTSRGVDERATRKSIHGTRGDVRRRSLRGGDPVYVLRIGSDALWHRRVCSVLHDESHVGEDLFRRLRRRCQL